MDNPEIRLTEADIQAAQQVLKRYPLLANVKGIEDTEKWLAEAHHRWGSDSFRLRFGLREPRNIAEQVGFEMFCGDLTLEEAQERVRAYVHRPVDQTMLQTFFDEMLEQLHRYGCFMQAVGNLVHKLNSGVPLEDTDEEDIDRLAAAIRGKSNLDKIEIQSVFSFLQEARVQKQRDNVRVGEYITPTAAEMVSLTFHYVKEGWKSCREIGQRSQVERQYAFAVPGVSLFHSTWFKLPRAQELTTLVEQEHALARVYLREIAPIADASSGEPSSEPPTSASPIRMSINHWSELAIGIDEHWRYWAMIPAPKEGQVFQKSKAIELSLPGERWQKVLGAFAESSSGTVLRSDLVTLLGYLPPGQFVERDGRARPGAVEAAHTDGMKIRQAASMKHLKDTLADMRRDLRKQIEGPTKRAENCLRTEDKSICSGFCVRFLTRDESERLIFGAVK